MLWQQHCHPFAALGDVTMEVVTIQLGLQTKNNLFGVAEPLSLTSWDFSLTSPALSVTGWQFSLTKQDLSLTIFWVSAGAL